MEFALPDRTIRTFAISPRTQDQTTYWQNIRDVAKWSDTVRFYRHSAVRRQRYLHQPLVGRSRLYRRDVPFESPGGCEPGVYAPVHRRQDGVVARAHVSTQGVSEHDCRNGVESPRGASRRLISRRSGTRDCANTCTSSPRSSTAETPSRFWAASTACRTCSYNPRFPVHCCLSSSLLVSPTPPNRYAATSTPLGYRCSNLASKKDSSAHVRFTSASRRVRTTPRRGASRDSFFLRAKKINSSSISR